jgi:hypothetical protein
MVLKRLCKDVEGSTMVEFAVIAFLLMLLTGGVIDFMHVFWQRNMLIKAVERGARIAAVSNPVAGTAPAGYPCAGGSLCATYDTPAGLTPGQPYPPGAFDCICSGATGTCATGPTGPCGLAYNAAAMNTILQGREGGACGLPGKDVYTLGMCDLFPGLTANNVVVRYYSTGLGFVGRPGGPVPTIDVSVGQAPAAPVPLRYYFLAGLLKFANLNFATAQASITGECMDFTAGCP